MHEFRKKPSKGHRDFECRSCNIIVYKIMVYDRYIFFEYKYGKPCKDWY